ncbi:MAG: hypothetical protein IIA33_05465 [Planctomycetes bacterium]|nr:hypothetical protein [Planctomycetota bacterium]
MKRGRSSVIERPRGLKPAARYAFSLLELMLVLGLLALLAFMVVPSFRSPLERSSLPESGGRMRALLTLTRANAMLDGLRYRVRFLDEFDEEWDELSEHDRRQPYIEFEADPIEEPEEFYPVKASWAIADTFIGDVWCYQVRFGEPTFETVIAELEEQEFVDEEELKEEMGLEKDEPWVLIFDPDGTSEWMTFRLIDVPYDDFEESELENYPQLDVIYDGRLGMVFLQRPLSEEEVDVLLEKGHSPILRRDFLRPEPLTEDDVLEINMRKKR